MKTGVAMKMKRWMFLLICVLLMGPAACKKNGNPSQPSTAATPTATAAATVSPTNTFTPTPTSTTILTCIPTPISNTTGTGNLTLAGKLTRPTPDSTAHKVVVLIHGWTTDDPSNPPTNGYDGYWTGLEQSLSGPLSGYDSRLMEYHWEADASTGAPDIAACLSHNTTATMKALNYASAAGYNGYLNGDRLAAQLEEYSGSLKYVTFIAHSAGAWVAYKAAKTLLDADPCVKVGVVLLDPFIPGICSATGSPLNVTLMNTLTNEHSDRIYLLENYYVVDTFTDQLVIPQCENVAFTSQTFSWRSGDVNLRVDYMRTLTSGCYRPDLGADSLYTTIDQYTNWHSEPLHFYVDTADYFAGTANSSCLSSFPSSRLSYSIYHTGFYNLAAAYSSN